MASIETRLRGDVLRYRVVWREDGRKQSATFATRREADEFRDKVKAYGEHWPPGEDPRPKAAPGVPTFAEWAAVAIEHRTRANARTKADYRRDLERHLTPKLGHLPIDGISADHVAAWVADRQAAGLSAKTMRNLHGFASSIVQDACTQHPPLAAHNPFARRLGTLGAVHVEEMTFLTPQEFDLVIGHVREEYRPLIRFLVGTGLRFGEATALQVRDVDLLGKRKTLTVTKAWKRTGPASWVVGEPKTPRSRRTISLSGELVELLLPHWAGRKGTELLFPGAGGGRLPHSEVYKRGWAPAVARARVCDACWEPQRDKRRNRPRLPAPCSCDGVLAKSPRIHDLRHTHVSWLLAEGIRLEVISKRVGHSSIVITFDRYGHLDPAMDDDVNAAVDRALARVTSS